MHLTLRFLFETYQLPPIAFKHLKLPCSADLLEIAQAGALGDGVLPRRGVAVPEGLFAHESPYAYAEVLDIVVRASTFTIHPFAYDRLPLRQLAQRFHNRLRQVNGEFDALAEVDAEVDTEVDDVKVTKYGVVFQPPQYDRLDRLTEEPEGEYEDVDLSHDDVYGEW